MKRHTNFCLQITRMTVDNEIDIESHKGQSEHGRYNSMHEAYAVIKEELEEFWDSIKANDPDPKELLQVCSTAKRALLQLCSQARKEIS